MSCRDDASPAEVAREEFRHPDFRCGSVSVSTRNIPNRHRSGLHPRATDTDTDPQRILTGQDHWFAIVGNLFGSAWSPKLVFDHYRVPPNLFSDLWLGIDWGPAKRCATILGGRVSRDVRLPDDRVIAQGAFAVHNEHVEHDPNNIPRGTNRILSEIWPKLIRLAHRNGTFPRGVIDSAASAKITGRNEHTITSLFRRAGVLLTNASKGPRVPRFETLKQMMVEGDFWVADRCRFWLGTVPALPRSKKNPEDVDTEANDHALDATSYLVEADSRRL